MKKIFFAAFALLSSFALTSCDQDFMEGIAGPLTSPEETPQTVAFGNGAITEMATINMADVTGETVQVCQIKAPTVTDEKATLTGYTITIDDVVYEVSADGFMSTEELSTLIENAYGKRPEERSVQAVVRAYFNADGQSIVTVSDEFRIKVIPAAPHISENYYIVGGASGDWAGTAASKELKFTHSGADVYDDPVFTIVMPAAEGDTWFAIGDDEALDAITNNNDWSKLLGTTSGNGNNGTSGLLDVRTKLADDGSFCVPAGNKLIKVTINMMEYSYTIEPVNISENYYLIGGPGEWNNSKDQKFSHSDKNVFDDPIFTYTFKSTGGEMWFAFGDDEAIDAVGEGVWNKLFGTKGDSKDLSGSFDYRYNLDGDHSFCVDGSAQYYRVSINMMEFTYEITPLNFEPFIYFIGATDGWANAEQKLASPNFDGVYTGYLYIADPNGWGNEYKFQRVAGSWDNEINFGTFTSGVSGDFSEGGGGNIKADAGEGIYYVEANLATGTLKGTRITNMNLVGDFNGWNEGDDAQQMTWDAENYCYVITGAGVTANGWKFTTNNSWGINLGGAIDNLVANGDNLNVVGTTIKLYPTRKTSDYIYCTVE